MRQFAGIYPAIVTAFDDHGEFDPSAMRRIVQHQLAAGVDGFYLCGGTGEGMLLTVPERQAVLETVLDEVAGRAGVIAHVGAFQTADTLELARHASRVGVDAIAALPPAYFYTPDTLALVRYYTSLAEASQVPLLIYNIPSRMGITMTRDLYDQLLQVPNIIGMKDSSGAVYAMGLFFAGGKTSVIFHGEDTVLLGGVLAGACGGIGATYNIMPDLFVQLWQAFQRGDMDTAGQTQLQINQRINALQVVDLFGAIKQTLAWMELPCGVPRTPLRPLTDPEVEKLRSALEQVGFFTR
jgi:N-acetylneuraminate lyase